MSVIAPPQRQIDELSLSAHPFWKADVVKDSLGPHGVRLTSLHCRFPRAVLAEFNTHRAFSRNASSRRAIPTAKMVQAVVDFPYFPEFAENQPGMSAGKTIGPERMRIARAVWLNAQRAAIECARQLNDLGVQKSWCAWLLEPFNFADVVVTSTDWKNFFSQRIDEGAQPEMQMLASLMKIAIEKSKPEQLKFGQWHLPFVKPEDVEYFDGDIDKLKLVSAARCARVSYVNHDGERDPIRDIELGYRLLSSRPGHLSPFEHVAKPVNYRDTDGSIAYVGNFRGFWQMRKDIAGENGQT